jgi:hypothetical protein
MIEGREGDIEQLQLAKISDSISRLQARIRLCPPQPPEFSMVALGKLNPGAVACRLNRDRSWQRVVLQQAAEKESPSPRSYRTYWQKDNLQIAAPQRSVLFVSGSDPEGAATMLHRLLSPGANPLPAEVFNKSQNTDLFLYFPDPLALAALTSTASASESREAGAMLQKLPIRSMWIGATAIQQLTELTGRESSPPAGSDGKAPSPAGSDASGTGAGRQIYEMEAVFLLSEVDNPRSVELLLRLMLTLWLRNAQMEDVVGKLKSATIRVEQGRASITALVLSAGEIASLLKVLVPEVP